MALLDELIIRIVADTGGFDGLIDDAIRRTNDLTDDLGNAEDATNSLGGSFMGLAGKILGAAAAAFSITEAITGAFERANQVKEIAQTAETLGIAVESLDAFGKAAESAGGDAEGARDTLTDVAEKIGEAFTDAESGAAKAFKALGVDIKDAEGKAKDGLAGFLDLAKAVEGLDKSQAVFKLKELGVGDNRAIELILKGRKELERMIAAQKEQGVITKEVAERAQKFNDTLSALKGSLSSASNSFFDMLIPALTTVVEWLKVVVDWAGQHKDFVVGFFLAIATVVTAAYLPAMLAAAAATIAATWPILLIGAAIAAAAAAFALLYDDIMNYIDGNESFIGQIFDKYPMVKQIVMAVIDAFKAMFEILSTGAKQIADFVSAAFMQIVDGIKFAIDYLSEAYGSIQSFVDMSIAAFQSMADGIAAVFKFIVDTVNTGLSFATAGIDKVKGAVNKVAGVFGFADEESADSAKPEDQQSKPRENQPALPSGSGQSAEDVPLMPGQNDAEIAKQALPAANSYVSAAAKTPMNSVTSNAISNTRNVSNETSVNVEKIEIVTQATDAEGISKDVGSGLQSELKNLGQETSTAVSR